MKVTTRNTNSAVAVLDLHGQLTLTTNSEALDQALEQLLRLRVNRVLLNLSDITFLDCSGVGHLLRARAKVSKAGGSLALCGLNFRLRRIFELFDLGQVFNTFESDESAIASFFRHHDTSKEGSGEQAGERSSPKSSQSRYPLWSFEKVRKPTAKDWRSAPSQSRLAPATPNRKINFRRA